MLLNVSLGQTFFYYFPAKNFFSLALFHTGAQINYTFLLLCHENFYRLFMCIQGLLSNLKHK